MTTILSAIVWIFSTLAGILFWLLSTVFWLAVWFLLPLAIVAFIAFRVAERVVGPAAVRGWVKSVSMRYGKAAWTRAHRLSFALGVLPFRVLAWFMAYTIWHSFVSLFWRPKWQPWARAWGKRWKPPKRSKSGRVIKTAGNAKAAAK